MINVLTTRLWDHRSTRTTGPHLLAIDVLDGEVVETRWGGGADREQPQGWPSWRPRGGVRPACKQSQQHQHENDHRLNISPARGYSNISNPGTVADPMAKAAKPPQSPWAAREASMAGPLLWSSVMFNRWLLFITKWLQIVDYWQLIMSSTGGQHGWASALLLCELNFAIDYHPNSAWL